MSKDVRDTTVDTMTKRVIDTQRENGREPNVDRARKIAIDSASRINGKRRDGK